MQKIRKILKSYFWENCVTYQPTNQPIITNNTVFTGWRQSKKYSFDFH